MPNSIEFKLLAPYNKSAVLIGSFSNWREISMQKDDKGYFRTSVELEDGIHQYKFRVQSKSWFHKPDEWVDINDPYITEIDASTGNGIARIKDGQRVVDDYEWQYDGKPLPDNHELVIYELLVSDFFHGNQDSHRGRYTHVIEKLDYLRELGINAIELLPVNNTPGDYNWGYIPSYFFAPQPNYGTTQELKQLIDECHARGIRVILDQLYNHSSDESPLLHIDRDYWYYHDRHHPDADPNDHWGPEFNYEYEDEALGIRPAWEFMGDVMQFWIQEYHIDGIRYDALKELDNFDFLYWITQKAQRLAGDKPFYNIGEHIPEKPDLISPNGPMDACWHETFYRTMQSHLSGEAFDLNQLKQAIAPVEQGYPEGLTKAINYLCNHDQKRLLLDLGDRGILDDAAFRRAKLGAVLLLTAVGVPLIWMGEEFGDSTFINANETDQQLGWSLLESDRNRDLFEYYKKLIALRKQNRALQTANIDFFFENLDDKVFAYGRWNEEGSRIVVVVNFSDHVLDTYQITQFPANGIWHEYTKNYETEVQNNQLALGLNCYEAQVFVWQ
jgi:1,4-alpha-glucan branching enzyme